MVTVKGLEEEWEPIFASCLDSFMEHMNESDPKRGLLAAYAFEAIAQNLSMRVTGTHDAHGALRTMMAVYAEEMLK